MTVILRFVTCHDLVSSAIRGGEMGFWASHVEALMPDNTLLGAHYVGGVQSRPRDYDQGQWTKDLYVTIPCTDKEALRFESFLRSQIGKPYDTVAIGEMALGALTGEAPDWTQSPAWICSALQTAALLSAGIIYAAPTTVRLATPRDVLCMCASLTVLDDPDNANVIHKQGTI